MERQGKPRRSAYTAPINYAKGKLHGASNWRGKYFLVLDFNMRTMQTAICPYFGSRHRHAVGDYRAGGDLPHRIAHCSDNRRRDQVTAPDGEVLYQEDGYLLRPFNPDTQRKAKPRRDTGRRVGTTIRRQRLPSHRHRIHKSAFAPQTNQI